MADFPQVSPRQSAVVPQREILAVAREAAKFLAAPSRVAMEPARYAQTIGALEAIYATCPKAAIFSVYVKHNIGKAARLLLQAHYAEWEKARAAS